MLLIELFDKFKSLVIFKFENDILPTFNKSLLLKSTLPKNTLLLLIYKLLNSAFKPIIFLSLTKPHQLVPSYKLNPPILIPVIKTKLLPLSP